MGAVWLRETTPVPATGMATRIFTKESEIEQITTTQILEKLKEVDGDNTEFFYLNFSTGGYDDDYNYDYRQRNEPTDPSSVPPLENAREKVMGLIRTDVLPRVLCPDGPRLGWKKVYDKDGKPTYRALYFNIIPKGIDEDNISYIRRVNKIRSTLFEEGDKLRVKYKVNFKINSLLSKPFLYDDDYLTEQSMRAEHSYPK